MPHVIVIAGPNGAGKTTAAPALLNQALHVDHFVNADTIAAGLSAFAPDKAAIQAGRLMLKRIRELANVGENFAFENTDIDKFAFIASKIDNKLDIHHPIFWESLVGGYDEK